MEETQTQPQITENSTAIKRSPWRWIWRILLSFAVLLCGLIAFLTTGWGQRTTLHWADKWLESLSIEQVEGSLQQGLTLSNLHFQTEGVDVLLGQTLLHIDFGCLFTFQTCMETIGVKHSIVAIDTTKLPPATDTQQNEPAGDFSLPIAVSLKRFEIEDFRLKVDDFDLSLQQFQTGISGKDKLLELLPTQIHGLTLSLAPQAVDSEQKFAESKQNSQPFDWAGLENMLAKPLLDLKKPLSLPVYVSVPEIKGTQIHIEQKTQATAGVQATPLIHIPLVQLSGIADSRQIQLTQLKLESDKLNLEGNGNLALTQDYPLAWQLNATTPDLPELKLPASRVDLTLSGQLANQTLLEVKTQGAINAHLQGDVALTQAKTPLQLKLTAEPFAVPLIETKGKPLTIDGLQLNLSGNLLDYRLNLLAKAQGMDLPESELNVEGNGGLTQFELARLQLAALNGSAELSGNLNWRKGIQWQSALTLNNINTQSLLPDWATQLSGKLNSSGTVAQSENGSDWSVNLSEIDIIGSLQRKTLQLKGALSSSHQQLLTVPKLLLIYGENQITLQGNLGEQSDLNADIQAPNLQGLLPDFNADMIGKIQLSGKLSEPELDLDLRSNQIRFQQFKLQQLTAKGNITTEKQVQGELAVQLGQFAMDGVNVNNARLTLSGNEHDHVLKFSAKGDPIGANLQISGKFDRLQQQWQGIFSQIALQSPVGDWKTDNNIQVIYDNQRIDAHISAHCWQNPQASLCFPDSFHAGKEGKVPFIIKSFNLAMIQPFLPKESELGGIVHASGEVAWFNDKAPQVQVDINSDKLAFIQKIDYRTFPLTLTPVKLKLNMAENNLTLTGDVQLENNGKLTTEMVVKDLAQARQLGGNIQLQQLNLSLIAPFLSQGEQVDGDIHARLTLGGALTSPLLHGELSLAGLKAKTNVMPFDVTDGNLRLNFHGNRSTLSGNIQTADSNLLLEGDANWQNLSAWYTRIRAQANRFRVDLPGMAKVDVSPDIEVKVTPRLLSLGGNIEIPWARIAIEELPESAIALSSDEVIMDGSAKAKKAFVMPKKLTQESSMAIAGDVTIHIGNDVKVDAYGLNTNLNGTLKVRQGNKGLGLYGQVYLQNGTFTSFGQDLLIRKGMISFTGLPSQPTLDIEAIRNPEAMEDSSIVAGVKVTGIAEAPDVKVFSTPTMSQDQALSYLLTGRSLENSGDSSSSNSIAAALIGLNLSKSSKLVGGVGSAFGINDLNVTTAGIGDNTKVVVEGSLTPKFKVQYGVGLFAPLTELTLRYRLAPSLYLEWVSSVNQAVDLMYRFEFD